MQRESGSLDNCKDAWERKGSRGLSLVGLGMHHIAAAGGIPASGGNGFSIFDYISRASPFLHVDDAPIGGHA